MSDQLKNRVLELYDVDVGRGTFRHKVSRSQIKAGSVAGCLRKDGYRSISIDNKSYLAHRIIVLVATGRLYEQVDHLNGDKDDNRIDNLREAGAPYTSRHGACHR